MSEQTWIIEGGGNGDKPLTRGVEMAERWWMKRGARVIA